MHLEFIGIFIATKLKRLKAGENCYRSNPISSSMSYTARNCSHFNRRLLICNTYCMAYHLSSLWFSLYVCVNFHIFLSAPKVVCLCCLFHLFGFHGFCPLTIFTERWLMALYYPYLRTIFFLFFQSITVLCEFLPWSLLLCTSPILLLFGILRTLLTSATIWFPLYDSKFDLFPFCSVLYL